MVSFNPFNNTGVIYVKMDGSVLEAAYKKIEALTCSMKFLSPEVTLYL